MDEARVRWLMIGDLELAQPELSLSKDSFAQAMADNAKALEVEVDDLLGEGKRRMTLSLEKLSQLKLAEVVSRVSPLMELNALLGELSGPADKRPDQEATLSRIEELVGQGSLHAQVKEAWVKAEQKPAAKSAIDGFVQSMREGKSTSAPAGVRRALEDAIFSQARALLMSPAVQTFEATWRGLRFVLDQCPSDGSVGLRVVKASAQGVLAEVDRAFSAEAFERPDAIFLLDPPSAEQLVKLAEAADLALAPIIFPISEALVGTTDAQRLARALEDTPPSKTWTDLRAREEARWLCAVANPLVLASEGAGQARRTVCGSPIYGLCGMLCKSFSQTGAFALLLDARGALSAPGVHTLSEGPNAGTAIPTETFVSAKGQRTLAAQGILALGSARNNDQLRLVSAPTVSSSEDAVPLPAQLLTGRIVRFAQWVTDQIPDGTKDEEVPTFFSDAAGVFLFPGMTETAEVTAKVVTHENGRGVVVAARVRPIHSGVPLELVFTLPLG